METPMLNPLRPKPHAYHSPLHLLKARIGSGQTIEIGSVQWMLLLARTQRARERLQCWRKIRLMLRISPIRPDP